MGYVSALDAFRHTGKEIKRNLETIDYWAAVKGNIGWYRGTFSKKSSKLNSGAVRYISQSCLIIYCCFFVLGVVE